MARKRVPHANNDTSPSCRTTSVDATEMEEVQYAEAVVALKELAERLLLDMGKENAAAGTENRVFASESILLSALADVVSDLLVTRDLPPELSQLFCLQLIEGVTSERHVPRGGWQP